MNAVASQVAPGHTQPIREDKLNELIGRVLVDFGAAYLAPLIVIGDRLKHMIAEGMTLEQIIAARPAMDYEPVYAGAQGAEATTQFLEAAYQSLTAEVAQ